MPCRCSPGGEHGNGQGGQGRIECSVGNPDGPHKKAKFTGQPANGGPIQIYME